MRLSYEVVDGKMETTIHPIPFPLFSAAGKNGSGIIVKHPHIPSALCKYRDFRDQHKDALSKGVLWRSSPDRFSDPYDSAVYFDQPRFLIEDWTLRELMTAVEEMKRGGARGDRWTPPLITNPIEQRDWRQKRLEELLKDQPEDVKEAVRRVTDEWFEGQSEQAVRRMSNTLRAGYSVLSLCENDTSVLMWSHYSNNHKGFCVEYDLSALDGFDPRRRLCYPVFYRRKLTDATRYLALRDPRHFNNQWGTFACLLKSDEWTYEKEWRLVFPLGASVANSPLAMPKPKSVILGALVEAGDEEWMRDFCQTNGIALKRVVQRHNEFRLEIHDA
jgi:Protein of unknown function (DUF2971)